MWILFFLVATWSPPLEELALVAETFAASLPKLKLKREADHGVFVGEIDDIEVKSIIAEMIERSQYFFKDETKFSPDLLKRKKEELKRWAQTNKMEARFSIAEKNIWVEGANSTSFEALREIFPFLKEKRRHKKSANQKTMNPIHLELAFVEIQNEAVEKLGLRFGSPISFATSLYLQKIHEPEKILRLRGFNPLGSFLDFVVKGGEGRVHFKQSLVGRDQQTSSFQVGGEFSVRLKADSFAQISTISYGVHLNFRPRLLDSHRLQIELDANIREPSLSGGIDGLPLIHVKKLKTSVVTRLGETIVVGGFVRRQESRARQGVPGLSEIPFFGRLLSSKDYLNNRSEAYLFITPSLLVEPKGVRHVD